MQTREDYAEVYAQMTEGELAAIALDGVETLNDEARVAFHTELTKRGQTTQSLRELYRPDPLPKIRGRSNDGYLHAGWFALREYRLAQKAQFWPVTQGRILDCYRTKSVLRGLVRAEIVYEYTFNAEKYKGKTTRDFLFSKPADQMIDQYELDDEVEVRFDPETPSRSYVASGAGYRGSAAIGIIGLSIWIVVAALFIVGWISTHVAR
jgi:hypothetical protein